jgi:hypothetical protein
MPHTALCAVLVYGSPSGTTGAGSPTHVAPWFSVRTIDVHGLLEHGAVPRTNASSVETNVTEVAANLLGTGPPAEVVTGPVAAAVDEGAADVGVVVADVVGEPLGAPDAVGVTDESAPAPEPELNDPHPATNSAASSAVMPTATPDARIEILISPPNAVGPQAVVTAGDQIA